MSEDNPSEFRPRMPERARKAPAQYSAQCDKIPSAPPKRLAMLPQDATLVTELAQKLKEAEEENESMRILLRRANDQNLALEQQIEAYRSAEIKGSGAEFEIARLREYGEQLEQEIFAMEQFLDQKGLVYVENGFGREQANEVIDEAVEELEAEVWKPPAMEALQLKISALNRRFAQKEFVTEEGVTHHQDGRGVQIIFFEDGIFIKRGPFRAYEADPTAMQFVKDVMDGFVPSELQDAYPDGISFEAAYDSGKFMEKKLERFRGAAKVVGTDECVVNPDEEELDEIRQNYQRISGYEKQEVFDIDDQKSEQLNPLPVEAVLRKISDKSLITGQVVKKENASLEKTMLVDEEVSDKQTATLRLTSNCGHRLLLKLPFDTLTTRMYSLVSDCLGLPIGSFIIQRALGGEVPGGVTLEEAGLVPNCRLMLRISS